MDESTFRKTETRYREIKEKLDRGEATPGEVKAELKRLMVQDVSGNYWMLGGKTGRWYIHKDNQWVESDPYELLFPSHEEEAEAGAALDLGGYTEVVPARGLTGERDIAQEEEAELEQGDGASGVFTGVGGSDTAPVPTVTDSRKYSFGEEEPRPVAVQVSLPVEPQPVPRVRYEQKIEEKAVIQEQEVQLKEEPARPVSHLGDHIACKVCKSLIPPHAVYCSFCGAHQEALGKRPAVKVKSVEAESELLIKSIKIWSFFFFLGGVGIFLGVILGAIFGIFKDIIPVLHQQLPLMLQETRGQLTGGLIFAAAGGIGGFIVSAVFSLILSSIYNLISSIIGGIRFKVRQ